MTKVPYRSNQEEDNVRDRRKGGQSPCLNCEENDFVRNRVCPCLEPRLINPLPPKIGEYQADGRYARNANSREILRGSL
jgi:hypothetical protein